MLFFFFEREKYLLVLPLAVVDIGLVTKQVQHLFSEELVPAPALEAPQEPIRFQFDDAVAQMKQEIALR